MLVCRCVRLFTTPWTVAFQSPLFKEFSWQEYWSRFPFPTPEGLSNPGTKLLSFKSPELSGRFFTTVPPGKSHFNYKEELQYKYSGSQTEQKKSKVTYQKLSLTTTFPLLVCYM